MLRVCYEAMQHAWWLLVMVAVCQITDGSHAILAAARARRALSIHMRRGTGGSAGCSCRGELAVMAATATPQVELRRPGQQGRSSEQHDQVRQASGRPQLQHLHRLISEMSRS